MTAREYSNIPYGPGVEVDPGYEEGLEGVACGLGDGVWVPQRDLLLQLVGNLGTQTVMSTGILEVEELNRLPHSLLPPDLLGPLLLPPVPPLGPGLDHGEGRRVHRVLEQVDVLGHTLHKGNWISGSWGNWISVNWGLDFFTLG